MVGEAGTGLADRIGVVKDSRTTTDGECGTGLTSHFGGARADGEIPPDPSSASTQRLGKYLWRSLRRRAVCGERC